MYETILGGLLLVLVALILLTPPYLKRKREQDTITPEQAILYQRTGKLFEEQTAERIVTDELRGGFVFSPRELRSLLRLHQEATRTLPPLIHH